MRPFGFPLAMAIMLLAGCSTGSSIPIGNTLPPAQLGGIAIPVAANDYQLGPLDTITIRVFNEPELSFSSLPVSLSGDISYPLLGDLSVAGLSTGEVAKRISALLNEQYLRDAKVSVSVDRAANFVVTVDGEVEEPGVYPIPGARLSLVQAVALGKGVTEFAKLDEVLVIREMGGQRHVARFDLREIRAGRMENPQIQQSDIVVVGFSRATSLLRVGLAALPAAAGLFVALR